MLAWREEATTAASGASSAAAAMLFCLEDHFDRLGVFIFISLPSAYVWWMSIVDNVNTASRSLKMKNLLG